MSHPFKLGAKKPVVLPNQPMLNRCKTLINPRAPLTLKRDQYSPKFQMFDNDQIGDCSAAGIGNIMIGAECLHGLSPIITTYNAVDFYSLTTGYNPADPSTDKGAVLSDVLSYAVRNGFTAGYYKYYPIWGTLDCHDRNALGNAMNILGGVYCGFALASADSTSVGEVWDTVTPGDQTQWSWGGHCAVLWSYEGLADTDIVYIITWGGLQKATWRWVHARIFEAHAIACRDFLPAVRSPAQAYTWEEMVEVTRTFSQSVQG